jgi:uracil-DNA glycosylase
MTRVSRQKQFDRLRSEAETCTRCPLHELGTQTVFGEGPVDARLILVGEQPGDEEDLEGRPFIGPSGRLLDHALEEAGIDRTGVYVTNTVKHFKWTPRGRMRLHKTPNKAEIMSCLPWLQAEIELIRPRVLVSLGATAGKALLGEDFRITASRGVVYESDFVPHIVPTVHPSSLLRIADRARLAAAYSDFVQDLVRARELLYGH